MNAGKEKRPLIMCFVSWYLPGFEGGGCIRSVANLATLLGDEFTFVMVTRDRDIRGKAPYSIAHEPQPATAGNALVYYLSPRQRTLRHMANLVRAHAPDALYLNSLFDPRFTTWPLLARALRLIPHDLPIILAPRGECAPTALAIHSLRKKIFLTAARTTGFYSGIVWQASTPLEAADILRVAGPTARIATVPDPVVPPAMAAEESTAAIRNPGPLRITFLSRIAPIKNLDVALTVLQGVRTPVDFSIHGPANDPLYLSRCLKLMESLPQHVHARYLGPVSPDGVHDILQNSDLFFLPTQGENFGHAIYEALRAGCPILISDQTPWLGLQDKGVGWDIPLDRPQLFREAIEACARMSLAEQLGMRRRARQLAARHAGTQDNNAHLRRLFLDSANPCGRSR